MQHSSLPYGECEFINIVPLNPLISKCQIKVCYVSDDPNRNKSVITKDVAKEMANSLPGSPIVGYYNEENQDFEGHNRIMEFKDGKLRLKDSTKPYGFVDLNAKVWFQTFIDDGKEIREYLMTEGYLWTGQYPECNRVIIKGNNQSMELDDKLINAHWTKDNNGKNKFFIINEAIISKLCILGENVEPCFEGANITNLKFSFEDDFKNQLFSLMNDIKEYLNKGGNNEMATENKEVCPVCGKPIDECVCEDKKSQKEKPLENAKAEDKEQVKETEEAKKTEEGATEEAVKEEEKKKNPPLTSACDKKKYEVDSLEEIAEYTELLSKYEAAQNTINELTEFKKGVERKEKQDMINSFYMLSDEDKAEVINNIDTYSLDDIEAKLCVICVRNKVSFETEDANKDENQNQITYNLSADDINDDNIPAWIKAIEANKKNK